MRMGRVEAQRLREAGEVARRLGPRRRSAHSSLTRHPRSRGARDGRRPRCVGGGPRGARPGTPRRAGAGATRGRPRPATPPRHPSRARSPRARGTRRRRTSAARGSPWVSAPRVARASARGAARHRTCVAGSSFSVSRSAGRPRPGRPGRRGATRRPRDDEVGEVSWPRRSSPRSHQVSATSTTRNPCRPGSRPPAPRARGARRPLGGAPSVPGGRDDVQRRRDARRRLLERSGQR